MHNAYRVDSDVNKQRKAYKQDRDRPRVEEERGREGMRRGRGGWREMRVSK